MALGLVILILLSCEFVYADPATLTALDTDPDASQSLLGGGSVDKSEHVDEIIMTKQRVKSDDR